jgi:alpha-L-rhamnosidase
MSSIPAPYLRKEFTVDREIASARLYVTAHGLFEFSLNGQRVGDALFAPGWTEYTKRIQYHVHDVTALLHKLVLWKSCLAASAGLRRTRGFASAA